MVDDVKHNRGNVSYVAEVSPGVAVVISGNYSGKVAKYEISDAKSIALQLSRKDKVASRLRQKLFTKLVEELGGTN